MAKPKSTRTYQQMSDELGKLIDWFESDQVNLDEAIAKYQQATELIGEIENYLKSVENKITKISAKLNP